VNGEVSKPSLELVIFWKLKDFTLLLYLVNILEVLKTIYVDVLNVVLKILNVFAGILYACFIQMFL